MTLASAHTQWTSASLPSGSQFLPALSVPGATSVSTGHRGTFTLTGLHAGGRKTLAACFSCSYNKSSPSTVCFPPVQECRKQDCGVGRISVPSGLCWQLLRCPHPMKPSEVGETKTHAQFLNLGSHELSVLSSGVPVHCFSSPSRNEATPRPSLGVGGVCGLLGS